MLVPEVYESLSQPHIKVILSRASESEEKETDDIVSSDRGSLPSIENQNGIKKTIRLNLILPYFVSN